jgi:hypothetical protein
MPAGEEGECSATVGACQVERARSHFCYLGRVECVDQQVFECLILGSRLFSRQGRCDAGGIH